MRKSIEVERRFLAKYLPRNLKRSKSVIIEDMMIITGEDHPHLRLRRENNRYELTKKYPRNNTKGKLEMVEETIKLVEVEFNSLKKLKNSRQIKTRYFYLYKSNQMIVDVWMEKLKGLVIVEKEFDNEDAANKFEKPDFCLKEITEVESLAGGKLSGKSFSDISSELKKLAYKKL